MMPTAVIRYTSYRHRERTVGSVRPTILEFSDERPPERSEEG
jgi:hypothetical protein